MTANFNQILIAREALELLEQKGLIQDSAQLLQVYRDYLDSNPYCLKYFAIVTVDDVIDEAAKNHYDLSIDSVIDVLGEYEARSAKNVVQREYLIAKILREYVNKIKSTRKYLAKIAKELSKDR